MKQFLLLFSVTLSIGLFLSLLLLFPPAYFGYETPITSFVQTHKYAAIKNRLELEYRAELQLSMELLPPLETPSQHILKEMNGL